MYTFRKEKLNNWFDLKSIKYTTNLYVSENEQFDEILTSWVQIEEPCSDFSDDSSCLIIG